MREHRFSGTSFSSIHGSTFMIALIPDLPDRVVGLIASAKVTASDYETVLVPAIEATIAR